MINSPARIKSSHQDIRFIITVFIVTLTVIAVSLIGFSRLFIARQKDALYTGKVKAGEMILRLLVQTSAIPLLGDDVLALNSIVKATAHLEGLKYVIITDAGNTVKAHTDPSRIGKKLEEFRKFEAAALDGGIREVTYTDSSNTNLMDLSAPVSFKNKTLGTVHLGLSKDFIRSAPISETAFLVRYGLGWGALIFIVVGGAGFLILIRLKRIRTRSRFVIGVSGKRNNIPSFRKVFDLDFRPEIHEQESEGSPNSRMLNKSRNQATVLFAGVREFKTYAEQTSPEVILDNLNEYLETTTRIIENYGGHIDKFVGDSVIGVIRSSLLLVDHTEKAVRAAVAMQKAFNDGNKNNKLLSMIGIGISNGVLLSGYMCSGERREITFIGESFKVAYTLSVMAGPGEILISKDVYQSIENLVSVEPIAPRVITEQTESWENFRLRQISDGETYG